jgi:hypothetical protein
VSEQQSERLIDVNVKSNHGDGRIVEAIAKVLIAQTWVSGFLALVIVVSAVVIPLYGLYMENPNIEVPDVIQNWGGVIIGFYFGSALTQMGSLLASLKGGGSQKTD